MKTFTRRQVVRILMESPFWYSGLFTQKEKLECVKLLHWELN